MNPIGKLGMTGPSLQVYTAKVAFHGYPFTDLFERPQDLSESTSESVRVVQLPSVLNIALLPELLNPSGYSQREDQYSIINICTWLCCVPGTQ